VVQADLNSPETLKSAFKGAYGVFAVTNFWEKGGADEVAQGEAAVRAAQEAGVRHFVWSTLPNVETISGGKYNVPHFTDKARVNAIVKNAGFEYHTFVIASFFYQNFLGMLAPQKQQDGSLGWTLPIDPSSRSIHMGDIAELGKVVAGALSRAAQSSPGSPGFPSSLTDSLVRVLCLFKVARFPVSAPASSIGRVRLQEAAMPLARVTI